MKETITELGSLCKLASELERKWDQAGKNYLGTRITNAQYTEFVGQYLRSVRRLETALSDHLVAVTREAAHSERVEKPEHKKQSHLIPAS